jgi:glutaredoxin
MSFIFKPIRWVLGQIIIFIDWLTRPKPAVYAPDKKAEIDAQTAKLALYQFKQCPFCVKTRRTVRRLGLDIETRDARNDPKWNQELISEGGKYQVPCLRIVNDDGSVEWLYESTDINQYLDKRFGTSAR